MRCPDLGHTLPAALVLLSGCAAEPATAAPPRLVGPSRGSASERGAAAALEDRDWGLVESARFSIGFPLPERRSWTIDDVSSRWLVARHADSGSELIVRTWRAGRLVKTHDCEMQARLWKPELVAVNEEDETVERRQLGTPPGYRTEVTIGAYRVGSDVEGYALAFGATVGQCFAAIYTTRATGLSAEQALGNRLAFIVDRTLGGLVVRDVDDRVRSERAPPR